VNPACYATPKTTPGYDPLSLDYDNTLDTTFPAQLAAAGCSTEQYYKASILQNDGTWATAICPSTFTETAADLAAGTSGVLACDSCTGTPPPGHVVIAWMVQAPRRCGQHQVVCFFPDHGCGNLACMNGDQKQAEEPPP
jgi:hypothetical protein